MAIPQAKFAERLVILNDFGNSLLEKLHYTYKTFSNAKSRPAFLNEPTWNKLQQAFLKKFPEIDASVEKVKKKK